MKKKVLSKKTSSKARRVAIDDAFAHYADPRRGGDDALEQAAHDRTISDDEFDVLSRATWLLLRGCQNGRLEFADVAPLADWFALVARFRFDDPKRAKAVAWASAQFALATLAATSRSTKRETRKQALELGQFAIRAMLGQVDSELIERAWQACNGGGPNDNGVRIRKIADRLRGVTLLVEGKPYLYGLEEIDAAFTPETAADVAGIVRRFVDHEVSISGAVAELLIVSGAFGTRRNADRGEVQRRVHRVLSRSTRKVK